MGAQWRSGSGVVRRAEESWSEFRQLSQLSPPVLFGLPALAKMQNKASVVIGLSGRNLKDLGLFSKSDPYVLISRQTQPGGAFVALRKSETINNNLNPDWKDFLIYESELGTGTNDDIEIEVFDDDGKPGRDRNDQSIGFVKTRVSRLNAGESFEIRSRKKGGVTGKVVVRTLRRNPGAESQPANQAGNYPARSNQSSGYPAAGGGGYPAPANSGGCGYPPPANYQPAPGVYPTLPQGGAPGTGYPGAPPMVGYPGPGYPVQGTVGGQPATAMVYPPVPPPASATLPYPVQPGPGMVHQDQQSASPGQAYPGQWNSGRKNSQGLISQMAQTVSPANPGGAGGFRLP